ncbi:NUP153 [Mytilus edulis]|uniref:Nuclear pore complex protein Nup153 n=1 Tax=Mytilus edulis TaxID=6550 RepID=A0A8S3RYT7_MYTED|nr:NUP153 [Mytilus edulis]
MSEEAGGKIGQCQHGSNKPYERRKSLLVKVKDLITPSWLSSFVNNKKLDETTEKDETKSEVPASSPIHGRTKQQNDKRPAPVFVSLEKRNGLPSQLMAPPQSTVIAHTRSGEVSQSFKPDQFSLQAGFTSSQLPLIPERKYDNMSDRSDHSKSTSGCSSMIPHPPSTVLKDRVTLELNESDIDSIKDKLVDSSDKLPNNSNRGPPLQRVSTPGSASIAANLQRFVPTRESTETTGSYQLPGQIITHQIKSVTFNLGDDNDVQMKYNYKSSTVSTSSLTGSPVAQGFSKPVSQTSSSSSSPSSGGFKVASQLKTGSVMDILGKSGSAQKKSPEAPKNDSLAKFAVKGWTCDICLVGNKEDSDKCVACTSPRPGAKTLVPKNDSLAKFAVKGWTCDICLVGNKDESDKCVACTSPRPGAKTSVPKNDSFAKFAGKGWTCNVCLVSNKDDAEKCVACAEAKPGLKKSTSKSAGGDSLQSIFKKPTGNWDCDVCLVPNNGDVTKCLACETPRPGTQPSSSGGLTIAPGAFSGQSGFILPTGSNSNSNMSNSGFGGDTKSSSGSGFKFSGGTTSAGSGFKFGDCSVKLSNDSDKQSSNVKSDNKEKGGFVFGKSNSFSPQKSAPIGTGFKFGENKPDEINKSGFLSQNSLSGTKDKSSASGFMSGKTSADSSDKTDSVSKLKSDSTVILDSPKISVTTSTVATTGLAFNSKSDSETKTSTGGINFGQSVSAIKPANGGFVFGQTSNNDTNVKTSVNSIFGTSSSNKSDNSTSIFGSDPKTSSINNFTGTNNSGFSFNKTEDKKSEPSFNNQSSTVSPSLKRSRDDETGPAEKKKPFAAPSSASSGLFQFGVKSTATTNASPSMAFGQNKDSKPTAFAAPSFNFGGAAPTNSATGFNAVPQTTTSSIFNSTGSSISSGTVFGSAAATVTSTSTGSSFVFGASSANPTTSSTTFGSTQQTSSLFSNKSSTPTFGTSSSIPSFGSPISTVGGFGSTAPAFGSSSTNPQFGASQPSATSGFGAQQTATPSFGTPQTTAPAFGTTQTSVPAFGAPPSSNPSFGTPQKPSGPVFGAAQNTTFGPPPVTSTTPGGFNFNAAPIFNFGQSSNTPQQPAAPSAGIFQFGGPKQAEAPQQPTVPSGGFNFGQAASTPGGAPYSFSAAPTPAATPSFGAGFGQPSTPQQSGTGMFNIGAGSTDNRKIKKAVRKIRR